MHITDVETRMADLEESFARILLEMGSLEKTMDEFSNGIMDGGSVVSLQGTHASMLTAATRLDRVLGRAETLSGLLKEGLGRLRNLRNGLDSVPIAVRRIYGQLYKDANAERKASERSQQEIPGTR